MKLPIEWTNPKKQSCVVVFYKLSTSGVGKSLQPKPVDNYFYNRAFARYQKHHNKSQQNET